MYIIKVDGELLYSPELMDDGYKVISPKLHMEVNAAGSLTFTIPPCNQKYDAIHKMKSIITVEQDGDELFRGRALEERMDFYRQKEVYCEGDMAFLLDSLQAPFTFEGTAVQFFTGLIAAHNAQMDASKQFVVGDVSGLDGETVIQIATSSFVDTSSAVQSFLLDVYGGYMRTRHADGVYYIDYISEYTHECKQKIEFGVNLLDVDNQIDASEFFTVLVPLGATTDKGAALTIADANDGVIYIEDEELIARYGRIYRTHTWDQVTDPAQLLETGQKFMREITLSETLTLKAVDMHLIDGSIDKIRMGDKVQLVSPAHRLDRVSVCAALDLDLQNGDQNEYVFGLPKQTMSDQTVATAEQLRNNINDQHIWLTETQTALNINVEAINLIGHRTTQLEIDVDAAEEAITMKASQKSVDILEEKHTQVELRLDAAEGAITAKADNVRVEALETEITGLLKADTLEAAIADLGDLHVGGSVDVPGAITADSLWVNGVATLEGGIETDDVDCTSLSVGGSAASWQSKEVVTGVNYQLETATTPPFYNANGTQVSAGITYVKNVIITPQKETINYLGSASSE